MSGGQRPARPQRVRQAHIEWVDERLSSRDRAIIDDLARVRLLTGRHIEQLSFPHLSGRSRSVVRWRVLKRLTDWRVLLPLERAIGGAARGSAGLAYTLDTAGQALAARQAGTAGRTLRRPTVPGERFVRHALTVSALYVALRAATDTDGVQLLDYRAEPDAWMRDSLGGWLKPDAYAVLAGAESEDHYAIEVDKATEHLPTIERKLGVYLDFVRRGQLGPHGVVPRVLITVPDAKRKLAIQAVVERLPPPAEALFRVAVESEAVALLISELSA